MRKTERRVEPSCRRGGILITQLCGHLTTRTGSFTDPERAEVMLREQCGKDTYGRLCPACIEGKA